MFKLPQLPYSYDALEPYIDAQTMEIHHTKHHQGYTDKLNTALEGEEKLLSMPVLEILSNIDMIPEAKKQAVINNGGGYANHILFWEIMSPDPKKSPEGKLAELIEEEVGSLEQFKAEFTDTALTQFGSGWAWLVVNKNNKLEIISTSNQDSPVMKGLVPLIGLDVWEHAYYLKYQNKRADYIDAWWNVLDWNAVEEKYKNV
ncbi:superoxide dismutase [Candidatus Dojkabacteria bacterium]|nr:superoxide dismutase [Candidatus Dojkabacteria bacterium]